MLFSALSALLCLQEAAARHVPAPGPLDNGVKNIMIRQNSGLQDQILAEVERLDTWQNRMAKAYIRNDCFFVTTAHLTGASIQDLSRHSGVNVPQPHRPCDPPRPGVTMHSMVTAFEKLGLRYKVWKFSSYRAEAAAMPPKELPASVGVAYRRPDGSGHVVVCKKPGTPYRRYVDYQANPKGLDVTNDVRKSRIYSYFYIDKETSKGEFYEQHRNEIQRLENEAASQPEPTEVFHDAELAQLVQGDFNGLNCKNAAANIFVTENAQSKRSIEGGNSLRARADEDCARARDKARELIQQDEEAAKHEVQYLPPSCQEEMTATPMEECTPETLGKEGMPATCKGQSVPAVVNDATSVKLAKTISKQEFRHLASSHTLVQVAKGKWSMKIQDIRAKLLGYKPLSPESPKFKHRHNLVTTAGKLGSGGLAAITGGMWVAGIIEAFVNNASTLDRAAAITAIVPFVGCTVVALAEADSEEGVDVLDKMLCFLGDAILLTPFAPLGIAVHLFRPLVYLFKPAEIPTPKDACKSRDDIWARFLHDKVYTYLYSHGSASGATTFGDKLNSALAIETLAVMSEGADVIAVANISAQSALDAAHANKAQIQAGALNATHQIRADISHEIVRRQRHLLLNLPSQLLQDTGLSLKLIAEQFNKELIQDLKSDKRLKEYAALMPVYDNPITQQYFYESIRAELNNIALYLSKTPPPLPSLFDIAYVLGQSKGLEGVDPLALSPQEFIKAQVPGLTDDQLDFFSYYHTQQVSNLLRGQITEDRLSNLWPTDDTNNARQLQILIALKFGRTFEEQKIKSAQGKNSIHPDIAPYNRGPESFAYLGLILGLTEERVKSLPADQIVIGYKYIANSKELLMAMLKQAQRQNATLNNKERHLLSHGYVMRLHEGYDHET